MKNVRTARRNGLSVVSTVEQDYARLKKGQLAKVFVDAYPDGAPGSKEKYFSGHIVRIAPKIDENARQGRVEIEIENPNGLLEASARICCGTWTVRRERHWLWQMGR